MIFLTMHARRRMEQRSISRDEIVEALARCELAYPSQDDPGRKVVRLRTTVGGRRLKIVTLVTDPEYIVTVAERHQEG